MLVAVSYVDADNGNVAAPSDPLTDFVTPIAGVSTGTLTFDPMNTWKN